MQHGISIQRFGESNDKKFRLIRGRPELIFSAENDLIYDTFPPRSKNECIPFTETGPTQAKRLNSDGLAILFVFYSTTILYLLRNRTVGMFVYLCTILIGWYSMYA